MKKILVSAFACNPVKGSEEGYGWNWSVGIANHGYEVHCITRIAGKEHIIRENHYPNLYFHFIELPFGLEKLYASSTSGMYAYYILWQLFAYYLAVKLNRKQRFHLVHHVTWGSFQLGSFMYKLKIPFIFGPVGGGQAAPEAFKHYFGSAWEMEKKRAWISSVLVRLNPACKSMIKRAKVVLVSNDDTLKLAKENNCPNVEFSLDVALPQNFFPENFQVKELDKTSLKLLWVGRFMPRKGLALVIDVMNELKSFKNISLTVVGDGELRESILSKVTEYGLEDTVSLVGSVPYFQVKEYYESHDVFFFTSLRDSGGVQLVEAMAYGMPVVTLNLHGQGIIVTDKTGIICDCINPKETIIALKEAILSIYEGEVSLAELSMNSHIFALKQTWDKKIDNIVSKYYL